MKQSAICSQSARFPAEGDRVVEMDMPLWKTIQPRIQPGEHGLHDEFFLVEILPALLRLTCPDCALD